MKYHVELLSCLTYHDKNNDTSTRLGYRFYDKNYCQNTSRIKGYSEMSYFEKGTNLFDKLNNSMFGCEAEITFDEQPSEYNPLRKKMILKSIKVGNELINLL